MTKQDHDTLDTLATRVNGAGSVLTAISMGLIQPTRENITTVILSLRDTADRLEEILREGAKNETL